MSNVSRGLQFKLFVKVFCMQSCAIYYQSIANFETEHFSIRNKLNQVSVHGNVSIRVSVLYDFIEKNMPLICHGI